MPDYRTLARQAARQVGVDPNLFLGLVKQESGFNPRALSAAGALGLTQLMPGTASGLAARYKIDTSTPYGNLLGGAYYLKEQLDRFKDPRLALAAYNAGPGAVERYGDIPPYTQTQNYVKAILGSRSSGGGRSSMSALPRSVQAAVTQPTDYLRQAALGNLAAIAQRGRIDPFQMLQSIVSGIAMDKLAPSTAMAPSSTAMAPSRMGKVTVAGGANRAGVPLNPAVIGFADRISGILGEPLEIGTGSNHNQFVKGTRRQSAHWTGRAADLPASGAKLTALGRAALVAAGMPAARANRVKGGLFNIGRYQIIFNSNEGGNHYNHLHIGLRG